MNKSPTKSALLEIIITQLEDDQQKASLVSLEFPSCHFKPKGFQKIIEILLKCQIAYAFTFHNPTLSKSEIEILADLLRNNCYSIKKLWLSNGLLEIESISILAKSLKKNTTLETLGLCHAGIGAAGISILAQGIAKNQTLKIINLGNNNPELGYKVTYPVTVSSNNPDYANQVTRHNNYVSEVGNQMGKEAAKLLKNITSLTEFYFSQNYVGDAGVQALASALKGNTELTVLDLSSNYELADQGIVALAGILKNNKTMKELYLSECTLRSKGAQALAELIKLNHSLTTLELTKANPRVPIILPYLHEETHITELTDALRSNFSLTFIHDDRYDNDSDSDEEYGTFSKFELYDIQERNCALRDKFLDACKKGDLSTTVDLLNKGISPDAFEKDTGNRALHLAVLYGHTHIARTLLERGANESMRNNERQSPLMIAYQNHHENLIRLFSPAEWKELSNIKQDTTNPILPSSVNYPVNITSLQGKQQSEATSLAHNKLGFFNNPLLDPVLPQKPRPILHMESKKL
jgi:Ankyrin repeats (3 copies)/Leucine Rich repeat